jgi:tripartite ATP-independent transporter DctP family solute receptor
MLKMTKNLKKLALAITVSAIATSAVAEEWKFAIEEIPGSIMDAYAQEFKRKIEAKTNGETTINIYPLGSLGTPTEMVEQATDGVVHFANVSVGNLGTIVPESQVFLLPYTLPSEPKAISSMLSESKVIYDQLGSDFNTKGLKLHTMYSEGPQVWTTNKPVRKPADLDNFKMRVMVSPILLKAYEDLGASPTPLPFGEVYGALQLKTVDGQINPVPTIEEMKFYEVTDYMIWAGEQELVTTIVSGTDWYETLAPAKQQLISETMAEMRPFIDKIVADFNQEKLAKIKAAKPSIEFIKLNTDEQAVFRKRSANTHSAFTKITGERGETLLTALLAEIAAKK